MSEISVRLGVLRVARRLSQQQLADVVGVRRDTISALERGKSQGIEFATLAKLCDALGVRPDDILLVEPHAHVVPVLGGEDEDDIIAERLGGVDLAALAADPGLAGVGLFDDHEDDIAVVWGMRQASQRAMGSARAIHAALHH